MIKPLAIAILSTAGLLSGAATASADDLSFGIGVSFGGHARPRGFVEFRSRPDVRVRPVRPLRPTYPVPMYPVPAYPVPTYPIPMPYPSAPPPTGLPGHHHDHGDDCTCLCRSVYVPPHDVCREETVCEPAVYEDRCVPVFEERLVPVFEEICVPIYEDRCDPVTGRMFRVQVGERRQRVQVGTRTERVQTGERHEQVMVRPEICRTVTRRTTEPGRYVTICDHPAEHRGRHDGEVMTASAYEAEMAEVRTGSRIAIR